MKLAGDSKDGFTDKFWWCFEGWSQQYLSIDWMWYVKKRMKSWLVTVLGLNDDGAFLNEGSREGGKNLEFSFTVLSMRWPLYILVDLSSSLSGFIIGALRTLKNYFMIQTGGK